MVTWKYCCATLGNNSFCCGKADAIVFLFCNFAAVTSSGLVLVCKYENVFLMDVCFSEENGSFHSVWRGILC